MKTFVAGRTSPSAPDCRRPPRLGVHGTVMLLGEMCGCHQRPDRSFFIRGRQLPLCARCTGIAVGYAVGLVLLVWGRLPVWACVAVMAVMFADWLVQHLGLRESTNVRRLVTGTLCGVGYLHLLAWAFAGVASLLL